MYNVNDIYEWPAMTRLVVFGLIFSIVFYIGYLLDLSNLNSTLFKTKQQEQDLKQQLKIAIDKEIAENSDLASLPTLRLQLTQWQATIISHAKIPQMLNEILKIGGNNHLYFTLFSPGDEKKNNLYSIIPIKITVVGSYHQLANFISQVANMPWIVAINNFIISNENTADKLGEKLAAQANAENLLTAEFNVGVVYQTENNDHAH